MSEFLSTLLQAVIIAAIPVCAGAVIKGIQTGAKYLASTVENETARKYLEDAADAVSTAVTYISQTYVDALKNSNQFTGENQEEALQKAVEQAERLLTAEARAFLENAYGDLDTYLISRIEAEVRKQKCETPHQNGYPCRSNEWDGNLRRAVRYRVGGRLKIPPVWW